MDYQTELKRLQDGVSNYWKPKVGQYKVEALTELEESEPFVKKKDDGSNEVRPQAKIKLLLDGEQKLWTFGIGQTPASTYGQLVELGSKSGHLKGLHFTVIVKSDGTKNDYTIVA